MAIFFLTYDLRHADGAKHYQPFWDELVRLRAHRTLDRACIINLNTTSARRVVEALKPLTEEGDRIVAVRMEPESYWYLNAFPNTNDWIKQNPPVAVLPTMADPVDLLDPDAT